MKRSWQTVGVPVFVALLLLCSAAIGQAQSVTGLSGVPDLAPLKKFYSIPDFRIGGEYDLVNEGLFERGGKGGVTLESLGHKPLRVSYIAVGTPQRDKDGKIVNAVVISSYYSGDGATMYDFWYEGQKGNAFSKGAVVGQGKLIDTDKHYVIFLDALGLWGTSKPSEGLGMKFPRYTTLDMVQANYRLLKDELGVGKVKLATGVSMGAMQSYALAVMHPDFVEAIMPVGGIVKADPVVRWLFQLMSDAMESDPVWRETKGDYYSRPKDQHPNNGLMFGWSVLGQTSFSFDYRVKQPWDVVRKDVFVWEPTGDEGANLKSKAAEFDVNDLLCRNRSLADYDLSQGLNRIKARTLIVHVKNDQWLLYSTAEEAVKQIPGAKLMSFEDPLAHYAVFRGPNVLQKEVEAFFHEIGMK